MRLLNRLEDSAGRFAVPQLTLILIIAQVIVYSMVISPAARDDVGANLFSRLSLIPNKVLEGEVWRLVTFVAIPALDNVVFMFFAWYLFYLMGTALEGHWGTFRYNIFLLVGWVATVAVSFLNPDFPASAAFWQGSVFLAFAYLYPDFQLCLFFILPIRIWWFALFTWISYGFVLIFAPWPSRLTVLAAVLNFFLFFGREILSTMRLNHLSMSAQARRFGQRPKEPAYYHRCLSCGLTDRMNPQMDFRYCSKCVGDCCYCADHLRNHDHVTQESAKA